MINWIKNFAKNHTVLFVITLIIIAILLYMLFFVAIPGYIRKKKARNNYNAAVNQSQDALNQLATQGVKPSYAQAQYSTWANSIEQALSGCGTGWASVIKPTLQEMKNDADVFALIQAYGVRTIEECGWGSFEGDLGATIGYKFSGWQFCSCNPIPFVGNCNCDTCGCIETINKILKSKSISFQF